MILVTNRDERIKELEKELYNLRCEQQKQREEDLKKYVGKYFYDKVNESLIKVIKSSNYNDYEFYTIELFYECSDDDYEDYKKVYFGYEWYSKTLIDARYKEIDKTQVKNICTKFINEIYKIFLEG